MSWRAAGDEAPRMRYWAGDYVVYSPLSGDTHFLDIAAGELLRSIVAAPQTSSVLGARLARLLEVPQDERLAAEIERTLAQLEALGLIEAC